MTKPPPCQDCEHHQPGFRFCRITWMQNPDELAPDALPWHCPGWTPPTIATLARRATTAPEPTPTADDRARAALLGTTGHRIFTDFKP